MENRIIGSHNSMSYLPVKKWWMNIFNVFARCQDKPIEDQNADCFDIRIYYNNELKRWEYAHGLIDYDGVFTCGVINKLVNESPQTTLYIRLILEKYKNEEECLLFSKYCKKLDKYYSGTNVILFGGNRKKDWKKLYDFKSISDSEVHQWVSSMAKDAKWYEKICPNLYAHRMNPANFIKTKPGINLFDFI